jgi:hypothetical protein
MENDTRQILKNVVADFGRRVLEEPDRLAGLLADYHVSRRETDALVYASRSGVAAEVRARSGAGQPVAVDDLAARLNTAVDPQLANSVLDAIAYSLGATVGRAAPAARTVANEDPAPAPKSAAEPLRRSAIAYLFCCGWLVLPLFMLARDLRRSRHARFHLIQGFVYSLLVLGLDFAVSPAIRDLPNVVYYICTVVFNVLWVVPFVMVVRKKKLVFPGFHGLARHFGVE